MDRKIPNVGCHWNDNKTDDLGDCKFEVFFCKIDDIPLECGGTPRKQTKQETMTEGLMAMYNSTAAANLVGAKFMISRSGQRLHVTTLPADVLRKFNLPSDYAATISPPDDSPQKSATSSGFGGFAGAPSLPNKSSDDTRLGLAAKCMFMQLAAALEVIYSDEHEDLYIFEVKAKPNPTSLAEAIFDNGEHFNGDDSFTISFGLLKQVEA